MIGTNLKVNLKRMLETIERLMLDIIQNTMHGKSNSHLVVENEKETAARNDSPLSKLSGFSLKNAVPLSRIFSVLSCCHELIVLGKRISQRQLYYILVHVFPSQNEFNSTVLRIANLLSIPRYNLNINAATRGVVAGNLFVSNPGARACVDCTCVGTV